MTSRRHMPDVFVLNCRDEYQPHGDWRERSFACCEPSRSNDPNSGKIELIDHAIKRNGPTASCLACRALRSNSQV